MYREHQLDQHNPLQILSSQLLWQSLCLQNKLLTQLSSRLIFLSIKYSLLETLSNLLRIKSSLRLLLSHNSFIYQYTKSRGSLQFNHLQTLSSYRLNIKPRFVSILPKALSSFMIFAKTVKFYSTRMQIRTSHIEH